MEIFGFSVCAFNRFCVLSCISAFVPVRGAICELGVGFPLIHCTATSISVTNLINLLIYQQELWVPACLYPRSRSRSRSRYCIKIHVWYMRLLWVHLQ